MLSPFAIFSLVQHWARENAFQETIHGKNSQDRFSVAFAPSKSLKMTRAVETSPADADDELPVRMHRRL